MIGIRHLGCLDHFFIGGIQAPVADIFHDRVGEQESVLQDQAQLAAQVGLADIADVLAVDGDLPAIDLIEAGQQVDDGGLAGAGGPTRAMVCPALASRVMSLMTGMPGR